MLGCVDGRVRNLGAASFGTQTRARASMASITKDQASTVRGGGAAACLVVGWSVGWLAGWWLMIAVWLVVGWLMIVVWLVDVWFVGWLVGG